MKCPKCGSEIKEQMLYCSVCGEEIRIVPDFDAAVDDTIKLSITGVIDEIENENKINAPTQELLTDSKEPGKPRDKYAAKPGRRTNMKAVVLFSGLAVIILAAVIFLAVSLGRYYSFDYQYEKALEEFDASEYEQSIETIRHALSLDETNQKIKLLLVDNYCELSKFDEALAVLYDILEQYPDDEGVLDKIAKIYEEKGDSNAITLLIERADSDSFKNSYSEYKKPSLAFSVPAGIYDDEIALSLEFDSGCRAYYTLDESAADNTKLPYTEPIKLGSGEHIIRAVCYSENGIMSDEIAGKYVVDFEVPDMPSVSVQPGQYNEPKLIKVTCRGAENASVEGIEAGDTDDFAINCKCYYTIDGDNPTEDDNLYDAPIAMYIGKHNYKFVAISDKGMQSEVVNLDITLDVVNLVDMGTAVNSLELWLNSYGLNKSGASYKCEQAYISEGITYYIINEYSDSKVSASYGVDVISGMLYKAKRDKETGEYHMEPVIKPL